MKTSDREYAERLGQLMSRDPESGVSHIRCEWKDGDDYIGIVFQGGHAVNLRVTGKSIGELVKLIVTAVYGR